MDDPDSLGRPYTAQGNPDLDDDDDNDDNDDMNKHRDKKSGEIGHLLKRSAVEKVARARSVQKVPSTDRSEKILEEASHFATKASMCTVCRGFSRKTCAAALKYVVSGLDDRTRLEIERELLDLDGTTCSLLDDKDCLVLLDTRFKGTGVASKMDLVGTMCNLLESDSAGTPPHKVLGQRDTSTSSAVAPPSHITDAEAHHKQSTHDALLEFTAARPAPERVETTATAASDDASAMEDYPPNAGASATIMLTISKPVVPTSTLSSSPTQICSICSGFSRKTCALALTNVVSGLDDRSRLEIERELLDLDRSSCSLLDDKDCLIKLDSDFGDMNDASKTSIVDTMCSLLESGSSMSRHGASSGMLGTHDSRLDAGRSTRSALLQGNFVTLPTWTSTADPEATPVLPEYFNESKSPHLQSHSLEEPHFIALSVEDALETLSEPPACSVCSKLTERACVLGLESSFLMMTPKQRLTVQKRLLLGAVASTGAVCSSSSKERDERKCLGVLDAAWAQDTTSKGRRGLLMDACALGAYGRAAAAVATASLGSSEAMKAVNYALANHADMRDAPSLEQLKEPGAGGAGMPKRLSFDASKAMVSIASLGATCAASSCTPLHAMTSAAAVASADALSLRLSESSSGRAAALKASFHSTKTSPDLVRLGVDDSRAAIGALVKAASKAALHALQRYNQEHPDVRNAEGGEQSADMIGLLAKQGGASAKTDSLGPVLIGSLIGVGVAVAAPFLMLAIKFIRPRQNRRAQQSDHIGIYQHGPIDETNDLMLASSPPM